MINFYQKYYKYKTKYFQIKKLNDIIYNDDNLLILDGKYSTFLEIHNLLQNIKDSNNLSLYSCYQLESNNKIIFTFPITIRELSDNIDKCWYNCKILNNYPKLYFYIINNYVKIFKNGINNYYQYLLNNKYIFINELYNNIINIQYNDINYNKCTIILIKYISKEIDNDGNIILILKILCDIGEILIDIKINSYTYTKILFDISYNSKNNIDNTNNYYELIKLYCNKILFYGYQ